MGIMHDYKKNILVKISSNLQLKLVFDSSNKWFIQTNQLIKLLPVLITSVNRLSAVLVISVTRIHVVL